MAIKQTPMSNTELIERLTKIIEESDERMNKTNDMVNTLSQTLEVITKEYSKHLDSLSACRDEQIKIIEQQQSEIAALHDDLKTALYRNDALVDKMLNRPSVNVQN